MKSKFATHIRLIAIFTVASFFAGCSSSDENSPAGGLSEQLVVPAMPTNAIVLTDQNAVEIKNTTLSVLSWLLGAADGALNSTSYSCIAESGANRLTDISGTTVFTFSDCPFLFFNVGDSLNGELNFTFNKGVTNESYLLDGDWQIATAASEIVDITGIDAITHADFSGAIVNRTTAITFAFSSSLNGGFVVVTQLPITRPVTPSVNSGEIIIMGLAGTRLKYEYGTNNLYLDNGSGSFVAL